MNFKRRILFLLVCGWLISIMPVLKAQIADPAAYPSADEKEWGQLLWNLKLKVNDRKQQADIVKQERYILPFDPSKAHNFIINEK
jgi:hypothetical protein